jgi:hypothetical protein
MKLFHLTLVLACVFATATTIRAQSPDNQAAEKKPPSDTSPKTETPATNPKKVWTNENISSARGQISVVGAGASSVGHGADSKSSFSNGAVFLSPHDGAIVRPGETLHVDVSVAPGVTVGKMAIVSTLGVSSEIRDSPPYSFTMTVPDEGEQQLVGGGGPLIGVHSITAFGGSKEPHGLAAVNVDVEEPDMPVKLSAEGGSIGRHDPDPKELRFFWAGMDERLSIYGSFPGGKEVDVTESTHLQFLSRNSAVIRASSDGTITSVGPGSAYVMVTYALDAQKIQLLVPVSVEVPTTGIIPTPSSLDFGNQAVGTTSAPLRVTLTNHANGPVTIYKLQILGDFKETDDCTAAPLSSGGTCTITVTFAPYRTGPSQATIDLPNNGGQTSSILLSGRGI